MNWELLALSEGIPPLIPGIEMNSKSKIKWLLKWKVDKWIWAEFSNNAWEDNDKFKLKHWAKLKDKDLSYPFEKINYKVEVIEYTDKEYDELLKDLNPGWSWEETDYLWSLCWQYDLRFIII